MSQTTPSHDRSESKNSAAKYCRPCVFTDHPANPHWCEGSGCLCEGDHNIPVPCGEIMIPERRRSIEDVSTGGFL